MKIIKLTPTAQAICIALARYRFLTVQQMLTLGVSGSKDTLYKTLRDIADRPNKAFVQRIRFGPTSHGQTPDLFHLKKHGAEAAESLGQLNQAINYPTRDYIGRAGTPHMLAVIDCHIALDQWAATNNADIDFCDRDFDPGPSKGTRKTSIDGPSGVIVPDMVFKFTIDGISRLCCLELYRDESSTRVVKSLTKYPAAMESIRKHYDYPHGVRILAVFTNRRTLAPALRAVAKSIDGEQWKEFYFTSSDLFRDDLRDFWIGVDEQPRPLFQITL